MIHIDRKKVLPPEQLESKWAMKIMQEAESFYSSPLKQRTQRRFEFRELKRRLAKLVEEPLIELFSHKCAFCESHLGAATRPTIEHFRPLSGAVNPDGQRLPDHYWWLALDWDNLYIACPVCNRTKGNRFPIVGDERAPIGADRDTLNTEPAFLLDPCAVEPAEHLVFMEDGTVAAVDPQDLPDSEPTHFREPTRGLVTIDTFGLNRHELISARRGEAARFLALLEDAGPSMATDPDDLRAFAAPYLKDDAEFLQMKRQLLAGWVQQHMAPDTMEPIFEEDFFSGLKISPDESLHRERAFASQMAYETSLKTASVESEDEAMSYRARTSYISRVEIRGFTSMAEFDFSFGGSIDESGGDAPWLMLLGENGVGKTSVLKAIALALAGPRRLEQLQQGDAVIQDLPGLFAEGGSVRVFLTSQSEPLEIRREGGQLHYLGDAKGARVFLRAFGPSRWFAQPGAQSPEDDDFVRIENLFNPFVPLESGEVYLTQLDHARWDEVALVLKTLLQIGESDTLAIEGDQVLVQIPGEQPRPLRTLSSGYEAVVAMSVDLIHLLFQRWDSLRDAEGVVLLDEIGSHLHPRWKMRIVESLRRAFPRVQFIATTHEPLCLRGLNQGEILVMQRQPLEEGADRGVVTPFHPRQNVAELRVDQLLTSRMFGLYSTLDPELEADLDRYYSLLSRHETALSTDEREELERLKNTVGSRGILGSTRRDQMIYQVIDKFVAEEALIPDEDERAERERWTEEQVEEFWSKLPDLPEQEA